MDILADENAPEEFVSALRGDGHAIQYTREIEVLGTGMSDRSIVEYAESAEVAVLTTDAKDFNEMSADVPILIAPQGLNGGEVRRAVGILSSIPADPAKMEPNWLSGLL